MGGGPQPIPAEAAGRVLYSIYFDAVHTGTSAFTLAANPRAAEVFRGFSWGTDRARSGGWALLLTAPEEHLRDVTSGFASGSPSREAPGDQRMPVVNPVRFIR